MIEQIAEVAKPVLEFSFIRRTRRNHALEHATIHMLSGKIKRLRVAGHSNNSGFVVIGDIPTEQVEEAAREALRRLRDGEASLALHPNCGTNLVTAGAMTTMVAWAGLGTGTRPPTPDRLSWTMTGMIVALIASQPIGMSLQKHITTKGDPGDLEIVSITRREMHLPFSKTPIPVHDVVTRRG